MEKLDEECLQFVVTHYKQNKLNTQRALARFRQEYSAQFQADTAKKKSMKFWMLTSGIAAAFMLAFAFQLLMGTKDEWKELTAQTEALQFLLPDKSSVFLYPHSSLSYLQDDFSDKIRQVNLEGKADFKVEKDAAHPFVVIGKLSKTKVLGTEFTIDESCTDTAFIQVQSGKVAYSSHKAKNFEHTNNKIQNNDGETTIILNAGMSAFLVKGEKKPQFIQQSGEQTERNFIFDNTPLDKVLAELSQYYGVRLSCNRRDRRLTARFDHQHLDEIISLIEKVLDVTIKIEEE